MYIGLKYFVFLCDKIINIFLHFQKLKSYFLIFWKIILLKDFVYESLINNN